MCAWSSVKDVTEDVKLVDGKFSDRTMLPYDLTGINADINADLDLNEKGVTNVYVSKLTARTGRNNLELSGRIDDLMGKMDMDAIGLESTKASALIYEVFSAFGTVGVSAGVTPYLSVGSKIIIIILMFIGRLGPITFIQLTGTKMSFDNQGKYKYVEEDFLIG